MVSRSVFPVTARRRAKALMSCLLLSLAASATVPGHAQSSQDPVYVFHTTLGDIRVQLFPDVAPQTVANFVGYINRADYNGTFIHRSVPGFVIQGGGYTFNGGSVSILLKQPPVINEFHLSNTRGTIAMAKLGGDPNSATDEWFFNESNSNAANLDNQNGGFTVFGRIADNASLSIMDQIAAVPTYNKTPPFDQIPLLNYQSGAVTQSNLVFLTSISSPSEWRPVSVSTGADGFTRVLWDRSDGTAAVWKVNASGQIVTQAQYGLTRAGRPRRSPRAKTTRRGSCGPTRAGRRRTISWTATTPSCPSSSTAPTRGGRRRA